MVTEAQMRADLHAVDNGVPVKNVTVQDTLGKTIAQVDAVAMLTEWEEFKQFQPKRQGN